MYFADTAGDWTGSVIGLPIGIVLSIMQFTPVAFYLGRHDKSNPGSETSCKESTGAGDIESGYPFQCELLKSEGPAQSTQSKPAEAWRFRKVVAALPPASQALSTTHR